MDDMGLRALVRRLYRRVFAHLEAGACSSAKSQD